MKCYSGVAVLAVAFTSFFYCLSIQTTLAAGEVATVIAEHGQTLVRQVGSSTYKALLVQDELHAGDIVKTSADGEADILFSDGSQLKLDSRTSIRITKSATAPHSFNLFQAVVGVIWAHLRPGQTIQTPSANIVVRGTEVELAVAGDGTSQLTVLSGNVSFYNAEGSIDLETGQQSTASPGSAPTAPIAVDPSGLISWTGDVVGMPLVFELGAHEGGQVPSAVLSAREVSLTTQTAAARNDAALWVQLGDTRRILGDTVGAQSAYASALNVAPGDPGGSEGLALTDMSQGNQGEALQALRPISSKPYGMAIRGLIEIESGNTDIAAQDLQAALSTDPTLYAAEDLLALIYLQHGNLTGAEKLARSAQVTAPRSPQALGTLSTVLLLEGNVKEATKDANAAVAIDPRSPFALLALGRTLVMGMRYEDARSVYERGLAFAPRLWLLHQDLAAVYDELGQPNKSNEEYRLALSLDPRSPDSLAGLGKTMQETGHYPQAEEAFNAAVAVSPGDVSVRYYYASFLVDRGQLDEALAQVKAVSGADPKFGLLYARLAEVYLYEQDVSTAQEYAVKAVNLLPKSALAHYELGRVYFEEQHTYQAEQEFRVATQLDPRLAPARYALGLVQEKTQGDLLSTFSSIFDSSFIGSPATSSNLNDVGTPGENERDQAALLEPTAVRAATRSYGDAELDAIGGSAASDNVAGSYLTDSDHSQGVIGVDGSTQFARGPRDQDDTTNNNASFVVGHDASDKHFGYLALGDYNQQTAGLDDQVEEYPSVTALRSSFQSFTFTGGIKVDTENSGDVLALFRGNDQLSLVTTSPVSDPNYGHQRVTEDSLDGELRWDVNPESRNAITLGMSYGDRHRNTTAEVQTQYGFAHLTLMPHLTPFQAYIRDDINTGGRWSFVGQLQLLQSYPYSADTAAGGISQNSFSRYGTTKLLPYAIASYQLTDASDLRMRYRQLAVSIDDFQLLNPVDDFLISYADLLQLTNQFQGPYPEGTSTEVEYDRSLKNGTFLSLGAFRQDLTNSDNNVGFGVPQIATSEVQGVQASYQGLITKYLLFSILGELQNAEDTSVPERVPGLPNYVGCGTLQYLNRQGTYGQIAYYYQGDRINTSPPPNRLGAFGILDLRVGKRTGLRTNIFAELNNALDKTYDDFGILAQGAEARLGISQRY